MEQTTEQLVQPFNAFEFEIWGCQAEIENVKDQRKKRMDYEGDVIKALMDEFQERWLSEIQELSNIPIIHLGTGHELRKWNMEDGFLSIVSHRGRIVFKYMMKDYTFDYTTNDEYEDLDSHDFDIYYQTINRDKFQRLGIMWAELEYLVPRLVYWNREAQALIMDINVKILTINLELKMMDEELVRLREKIRETRCELLKAGHSLDLGRRFYWSDRKFEYTKTIRVTDVSTTAKTCTIHLDYWVKEWCRNSYRPTKKREKVSIKNVRMQRLLDGLREY